MINLRIVRRDRGLQLLAECQSHVVPARGELIQLDTLDASGEPAGPSTMWKVVGVTLNVPSVRSAAPLSGAPLAVRTVEVHVTLDGSLLPEMLHARRARRVEDRHRRKERGDDVTAPAGPAGPHHADDFAGEGALHFRR